MCVCVCVCVCACVCVCVVIQTMSELPNTRMDTRTQIHGEPISARLITRTLRRVLRPAIYRTGEAAVGGLVLLTGTAPCLVIGWQESHIILYTADEVVPKYSGTMNDYHHQRNACTQSTTGHIESQNALTLHHTQE